ncbi:MAG TPA: DUF2130 domain-containing protein [Bacteroidia bacterium]|jgi:hypothetical protein|nr:DUF2130 domain-containing protein [Bacteroidia bacterium]
MSNKSTITCPNCKTEFEATDAFRDEVQRELNTKAKEWQLKREEEFKKKEDAFQQQLNEELSKQKLNIEETVRKSISNDYENKLKLLNDSNIQNEEKLKIARQKELEFLKKEQELKTKEAEMEISVQKKLNDERSTITETIRKQEQEKSSLKIKELEKQRDDSIKLAEEMKRRAEQGSMQLQGEVLELALEELLKSTFPFDLIEEVGKGIKGADCMQHVRNSSGQVCGKIIFESKRTKAFTNDWIEKLKNDMRSQTADIAVIVTETMPKDMERFGMKDGVWICNFSELKSLAFVLRDSLIKIQAVAVSQDNRGDKMQLLYNYLTSNEFKQQIEAIVEGFTALKDGISKEKIQMEKIWKEREKQLEKVMLNTTHFYGSVKGIAGNAIGDIKTLELGE